ncbi:hypothetical protein ACHAXR_002493 [Thalassiosira sp. AJA248-18]
MEEKQKELESEPAPILAIMGRFYPFDDSGIPFAGTTLVIKEMQNQSNAVGDDGGTGLNVWDGSLLLARYLEKKPEVVKNKTVLELGSGCGLVGIASGILGAKEVIMTDLPYSLPLMRENVERNKSSWMGKSQRIECKECDWFQPPPMNELLGHTNKKGISPDVILVADCVWLSCLIAPLLQTLKTYESARVLITYQQRGREAHEEFWHGIHDLFDVDAIDTEKSVGLVKPDVFHVFECSKKNSNWHSLVTLSSSTFVGLK